MKCSEPGCNEEAEVFVDPRNGRILKHMNQVAVNAYRFKMEIEDKIKSRRYRFTAFGDTSEETVANMHDLQEEYSEYCEERDNEECHCGEDDSINDKGVMS